MHNKLFYLFLLEGYQYYQNPSPLQTSIINGGINWTAIKSGNVDLGKGSPLYNRLIDNGKIDKTRSLRLNFSYTMDEIPDFGGYYLCLLEATW